MANYAKNWVTSTETLLTNARPGIKQVERVSLVGGKTTANEKYCNLSHYCWDSYHSSLFQISEPYMYVIHCYMIFFRILNLTKDLPSRITVWKCV